MGWKKVEDKSDGPYSWTEYTDYDGFIFKIFNIMMDPGFSDAKLIQKDI